MPVLSGFGHEVCALPTAFFSNHTAFDKVTSLDMTTYLRDTINTWKDQHIYFDCIYTGYIKNKDQLSIIGDFIDGQKLHGAFVVVDPCMADNGKLYSGFDETFPSAMKGFCKKANVILPNTTEAELLGTDLQTLGPSVIIKGLSPSQDRTGISYFDAETQKTKTFFHKKYSENFPGTGDLFASYFTGSVMKGDTLWDAACKACDFVEKCIARTLENSAHRWYGTDFESML